MGAGQLLLKASPPRGACLVPVARLGVQGRTGTQASRAHGSVGSGLCGNFNGDTTDDFMTSMGMAEGTASLFVDSWRAGNCPAALERETDPCSMSQLNSESWAPGAVESAGNPRGQARDPLAYPCRGVCGDPLLSAGEEGHCVREVPRRGEPQAFLQGGQGLLAGDTRGSLGGGRAGTHAAVSLQRCVYQACNYEETFPYICAALGDYAHMCASRGILLWGWRNSVENCSTCRGRRGSQGHGRAGATTRLQGPEP